MINWKEFEEDLHWIAETGRGQTSVDVATKWKVIIKDTINKNGENK